MGENHTSLTEPSCQRQYLPYPDNITPQSYFGYKGVGVVWDQWMRPSRSMLGDNDAIDMEEPEKRNQKPQMATHNNWRSGEAKADT